MDYKELIDILKDESNPNVLDYIDDAATAINALLARAEAAEARAEKAERERDAAVQFLISIIRYGTNPCECCKADCIDAGSDDAEYVSQCGMFEWSGPQKEE